MALVTITGNAWDHSRAPIPASLQPRLWFRPIAAHISGSLLAGVEVQATLTASTGAFTVKVESGPGLKYRVSMDWLVPGQETEPPENRARSYVEWPYEVYPDVGGDIGDLITYVYGVGDVYVANDAPNYSRREAFQLNPSTQDLYRRRVTW